ncbi:hypothetical protein WJX81_000479 [Elliptochloris bilobata]|uniref:N-acetyltransferase domain-containing protein n=1 Tax=Elliptochloris bilobata TaxID=381761 RepID=A0AAW1QVB3_9CHLO
MLVNFNLTITGERVVLVPYRQEHVPVYHEWMENPALQEATASEPLTIEEEYEMQRSWARDSNKCTFVVLDRALPDIPGTGRHGGGMAGDVNLFFNDPDNRSAAEIEIMIAEPHSRRRGLGREALELFMAFAVHTLGVTSFRAKIGETNSASLHLFTQLGFAEASRSSVFQEITMEFNALDAGALAPWARADLLWVG